MSATDLADRLGVSQQRVSELERQEVRETLKLDTLRRAAAALDCDLVYAFVPRTTLQDAAEARARAKALEILGPVAHHSRLEDQSVDADGTDAQLEELAAQLLDSSGLWSRN